MPCVPSPFRAWCFGPLFIGVLLLTGVPAQAQDSFSIEEILGAPFPSDMTAAPTGDRVAWVQNKEGVRSLWTAAGPSYQARRVVAAEGDDGQRMGEVTFTPDGRQIVYVRGGAPNRNGVHANPRSRPDPAERAVWSVSIQGGVPQKIGAGHAPTVAPSGSHLAFLRNGQVWAVPLPLADTTNPARLFTIRGDAEDLRWSPSGDRLAFVSDRGDHGFVGVYDLDTNRLRYLSASVDHDSNPVWSPDGNRIAFLRVPHEEDPDYSPDRTALPWSIHVANLDTGESRTIWTADAGLGSAFQSIRAENQLFWGAGDRIVFPWEKTGWLHLYSVPADGGRATPLTAGPFEVQFVTMAPDRESLIYASNQNDPHRRHLWRVSVGEGSPTPVTQGSGIEWAPVVTAASQDIAFLASGARTPAHPEVRPDGAERQRLAADAGTQTVPQSELVTPDPVTFSATDGKTIHGQLFRPPDLGPDEQRPAVVFFHGGPRRQMLLGFHYRGYYHNAYSLNQYLANQGYIVLAVNYRGGIGYGLEFREALEYGPRGASEFKDALGAGLYLRQRSDVDPDRIGLWGGSYGGYLTALGLARASDLFAAGVDLHGVHDWTAIRDDIARHYPPSEKEAARQRAFESSPMSDVEDWESPVLLIHGDDDRNVPFSETVDLVQALRTHDVPHETLVFPDEVHGFLLHENWLRAYRSAASFFDRTLRDDK
ncbi:MAG: prolyl oligopeptidase family serine peptidase [Salinibacter sp.]|uniref:S9 family peptidase n=1 Tax=Salinibacter sp. TaxID=2065818 RepID=UPI0035D4A57D